MKILWVGIALCLSVGRVQGMDQEDKVMRDARYYVRRVVINTLEEYFQAYPAPKQDLGLNLHLFKGTIFSRAFVNTLNQVSSPPPISGPEIAS